jgi:hypothetical protein
MSNLPLLPVPMPEPCSQTVAEASAWYRDAVAKIAALLETDEELPDHELLVEAWNAKCRSRLAAALSLYSPGLVEDFFAAFPLPSVSRLLELARTQTSDDDAARFALDIVLGVSTVEKAAFPGTVGEAIGMTMHNVDGKTFVMTEEGWREQTRIAATPLLPHPGMVKSAIYPTSSVWREAPASSVDEYSDATPALMLSGTSLWLAYSTLDQGTYAVVAFDGHVEHQTSHLAPDTLRNHPYASAGLKPFAFNALSESLQSIYWAPLGAKHWIVSLPNGAIDVVARSVRVVATAVKAASAGQALLAAPGFAGAHGRTSP